VGDEGSNVTGTVTVLRATIAADPGARESVTAGVTLGDRRHAGYRSGMTTTLERIMVRCLFAAAAVAGMAGAGVASGPRTINITVTENGFEPTPITVKKGEPITLVVTRKTDATCAKQIVLDEEKIKQDLPLDQPVKISFTPKRAGELKYGCAMGKMMSGVIKVVEPGTSP
jgi:plastocyanin